MKKGIALTSLATLALLALPAWAGHPTSSRGHWGEAQAMRIQLGILEPRGESTYWSDKAFDFTGDINNFDDAALGIEYQRFLGDRLGLVASGTFFEGSSNQAYVDFIDEFGNDIFHTTDLEMTTLNLGLIAHLVRRDRAIVPYVGAGGGLFLWRLTEVGDFIDFSLTAPEVFYDFFEEDGVTLGYYLQAGLEVPLARNLSLYGEGRWQRAEDDLEGDFAGLGELDLSGRTVSAGLTWSF